MVTNMERWCCCCCGRFILQLLLSRLSYLLGSQLFVVQYVLTTVVIVGSRWCSGFDWREGRHDDKDIDRGRVDVVVDDKGLLRETNKHELVDCNCN